MTTRSRSLFIVVLLGIAASTVTHGKDAFGSMPRLTAAPPFSQQGPKLVGSGAVGNALQGDSVALSADGDTAIVGGFFDNGNAGAAWVWTRSGGVSTQQGSKLVGSGAVGPEPAYQGSSVSLSADGNTAIVGGPYDGQFGDVGAAWVWTRSAGVWTQQGPKLVGSGGLYADQGWSVSLSADGNTALVGGFCDNSCVGAAWVWTRSAGVWTQEGPKLVGSGVVGTAAQGRSVALSADGNTALIGGFGDNSNAGAAWVWTRSAGVWTQQGLKLVGSGAVGTAYQGASVSLSADGNIAIVGGGGDNSNAGAAWVWTRSDGVWIQQGSKLVGSGVVGQAYQGGSVSLAADGNTAIVGGPLDNGGVGAAWVFAGVAAFTDDPLVAGVTVIKAQHVLELRNRIDTQRARFGLGAYSWSDATLTAQTTVIKAAHLTEMRTALDEAYVAYSLPPPSYTDSGLAPGTVVKAIHITELRNAVIALESS